MTVVLPGAGETITMRDINAAFGFGYNLGAYRGKRWYYPDGRTGTFPPAPQPIAMSDFYGKQGQNPVTPSTVTYNESGVFVVPHSYTTMIVTVRGGGGGAAGAWGTNQCIPGQPKVYGQNGFNGGDSSFGLFASSGGGFGGNFDGAKGANGGPSCDGIPQGGGAFGGGGAGGAGGYSTVTLISPAAGGGGPAPDSVIQVNVGQAGAGGQGGGNYQIWNGVCTLINYASKGQNGVAGSVFISWT